VQYSDDLPTERSALPANWAPALDEKITKTEQLVHR